MLANKWFFCMFLCAGALQDAMAESIAQWLIAFGILGAAVSLGSRWGAGIGGGAVGLAVLAAGRVSGGKVGAGDGWFFIVSGLYLGFQKNMLLLLYSLLLCCFFCLCKIAWDMIKGGRIKDKTLPFLPFVLPVGLWMTFL